MERKMKSGIFHFAIVLTMALAMLGAVVTPAKAQGIDIFVDNDFVDDPPNHKWDTITEGIADATSGAFDTVYVGPGTYNENLVIDKSYFTLQGMSSSQVTVNGGNSDYTIRITADDVTIRQLTIRGGNPAGVLWENVSKGYIEKCNIKYNFVGVELESIYNQTIKCNTIHHNSSDGINVVGSTLKDVIQNDIYANGNDGIALINSTTISTYHNRSYNNSRYGIYVTAGSTTNDIYLNDFFGNGPADGYSAGSGNEFVTPKGFPGYWYNGTYYDGGKLGNYWGDYAGADNDDPPDGIGDTSYALSGGVEFDNYPLVDYIVNYPEGPGAELPSCPADESPPDPPGGWPAQEGGGGCFVASAAYGSYMDSHVQSLRDFRDGYMATNPVGSALVSTYYKMSPPIAQFIDDHPALKPVVRAGLLPSVGVSTAAIETTLAEKTAITGSLILVSVITVVWLRRKHPVLTQEQP